MEYNWKMNLWKSKWNEIQIWRRGHMKNARQTKSIFWFKRFASMMEQAIHIVLFRLFRRCMIHGLRLNEYDITNKMKQKQRND